MEVRLDGVQFALSALQTCETMRSVGVVAGYSTFGRLHAVPCAFEVGYGVLARLRPHAFLARSLRRPLFHRGRDGRPELLSRCH
jgi:hypothetical protein